MNPASGRQKLVIALLLGVVALEVVLRAVLGTTPLTISHPSIEYMLAPNQDTRRFGNRVLINEHGMRSVSIANKIAGETRVLVLGDSVVYGGDTVDQQNLATEFLRRSLRHKTRRPVTVMNVSAGSWGPPNLLAYVEAKGDFGADFAVIVLSTHDHNDAPTFEPLNSRRYPNRQTTFAIQEAVERYLPEQLARLKAKLVPAEETPSDDAVVAQCVGALQQLVKRLQGQGIRTTVILHPSSLETNTGRYDPGAKILTDGLSDTAAQILEALPAYASAESRGVQVFEDEIHLTAEGHEVLGQLMFDAYLR